MSSVSVIICTRNRASDLRKTLARLSTHPVPTDYPVDMWVVDNGSTDETPDVVSEAAASFPFRLNYAREETQGVAHARNKALRVSGGDILLFTDDDVRVPKNWIDGMTRSIRHNSFDAAAGGVRLAPHLVRSWMEPWHRAFLACTDPKTRPPQTMIGANMAFSRTVLSTVPAFDTHVGPGRLGFAEETHFAERLLRAGYRIADAFDVEVEHHCDPSRLHRTSFLSSAERLGRTMAHLHYHWRHEETPFTDRATQIYIKLAKTYVKLSIKRMLNPRDVFRTGRMRKLGKLLCSRMRLPKTKPDRAKNPAPIRKVWRDSTERAAITGTRAQRSRRRGRRYETRRTDFGHGAPAVRSRFLTAPPRTFLSNTYDRSLNS